MSAPVPLVLHVIHHLVVGGMENGLVNLINRMDPARFRHAIVCIEDYSDFRQRLQRPGVEVIALHRSRIGVWAMRRELFRLCRRLRPAIVHSRGLSGLDAQPCAWLAGVPHRVHGEHGWDVHDLDGRAFKPMLLRRLHAPFVERYVTVSRDLERYLVERVHIAPARVTPICNGVDTARFAPAPARTRARLPAGFANAGSVVFGTVGRLQPVKDQATLVRAFAALVGQHPEWRMRLRLAIVGDGPLRAKLQRLIASLGIEALCWMPGAVSDVPAVLRDLDVFVLPSLNEGISNTVLEAMASGLPVLATAVGGNPELVDPAEGGRLFAPGDEAGLVGLMADFAADPALVRRAAESARRRAVAQFGIEQMVRRYQGLYETLCGLPAARRAESS